MSENESKLNSEDSNLEVDNTKRIEPIKDKERIDQSPSPKWINNRGEEVKQVFGFNENSELVNGRAAMIGFLMLILTELIYKGDTVTKSIFGIN